MKKITKIEAVKENPKRKLRVAAYARVSTESDKQLVSLEAQKNHYETYIKARPDWEYAGLYFDEGVSGTKMAKRDGLLSMLEDCERGLIDYIIVKSISRFSRNTVESIETIRSLSQKGIYVFFERENIDTGKMESELLLSILSSLAESESRSISENNKWGIQKRFQNGTYQVSSPPYGYRKKAGELVIEDSEAETVKWIFSEFLSGKSSRQIAIELNEKGILSKQGRAWKAAAITGMLRNEKYQGDLLLGKTYTDSEFNRHKNYGERDMYYISDHHEPIIDRTTFEAAKRVLEFNRKEKNIRTGKASPRNALSGKIICGECKSKWKRQARDTGACYTCSLHISNKEKCSQLPVREDSIRSAFATMMNKLIFARNEILLPLNGNLEIQVNEENLSRIAEIDESLEELMKRRCSIDGFFCKGLLDPAVYQEKSDAIKNEENNLKQEKESLSNGISSGYEKKKDLAALLRFAAKGELLTEFSEKLFTEHVDHIEIYNKAEIGFFMKCGPVFRERMR